MAAKIPHATRDDAQTGQPTAPDEAHPHAGGKAQTLVVKGPDVLMATEGALAVEGTARGERAGATEGMDIYSVLVTHHTSHISHLRIAQVPTIARHMRAEASNVRRTSIQSYMPVFHAERRQMYPS